MKNKYFDRLAELLERVQPELSTTHRVELKNVFGAAGGYVNGRIFISYGKFGVALRLPSETLHALFQQKDVQHLKYFPKGHVKKEYAVLPKRIVDDTKRLCELLDESVQYALHKD